MKILASIVGASMLVQPAFGQTAKAEPTTCEISYGGNDELLNITKDEKFGFKGYDKLCEALREANMAVSIVSEAGVLRQRSYGWVVVSVFDRSSKVFSSEYRTATSIGDEPLSPNAKHPLSVAMNSALEGIADNPELYIKSVRDEERRLKGYFGK